MTIDFIATATKYAKDVVAGKIPNCKWVVLACKKHLDELKESKKKEFLYRFDEAAAIKVCKFVSLLPHTKGKWAQKKELITLEPWQVFILCCLFGWKRKKDGLRRFRDAYIKIPRKNGKSILAAGIALYMFCLDNEFGAEVYSGATTEKQAWEVFRPAKQMVERSPELREALGVEAWAKTMVRAQDGSRFEPLIGKPGDGSSPSCAVADEYHEHESSDLVDTMQTGMGARSQPLILKITTAGFNIAGPCYDQELQARKMLQGVVDEPELFSMMYGIDDEDDWASPEVLRKANPNFGVSVDGDYLIAQQRAATNNPRHQVRFKTKHLNVWCSAKNAWMNMQWWNACKDESLNINDFKGDECYFILDLASKLDICTFGKLFRKNIDGQNHYYFFPRFYLPEKTLEDAKENEDAYRAWANAGLLTLTDGEEIDFDFIREEVEEESPSYSVQEILYDPWRATQLAHQLQKSGATVVEYRQTVQNLSPPMKEMEAALKAGRFHHDGNHVMTWMVSNVVAKEDAKENVYPRKEKSHLKIDGAITAIMGIGRAMLGNSSAYQPYDVMVV